MARFFPFALFGCVALWVGGAWALAFARWLRPNGPSRWCWSRLGAALGAMALAPLVLAIWPPATVLPASLPPGLACLPVAVAFARDGTARTHHGARAALGLIWLSLVGWTAACALLATGEHLDASIEGIYDPPIGVITALAAAWWAVAWTSVAVWRFPSARDSPLRGARYDPGGGVGCDLHRPCARAGLILPSQPRRQMLDLAGNAPPAFGNVGAVQRYQGPSVEVAPDTPLSEAPRGAWRVEHPGPMIPDALRFRRVAVDGHEWVSGSHKPTGLVEFSERNGAAVVLVNGSPLTDAPHPLDAALVGRLHAKIREHGSRTVLVRVEPSARWTVQDLISLCASAAAPGVVRIGCRLNPSP